MGQEGEKKDNDEKHWLVAMLELQFRLTGGSMLQDKGLSSGDVHTSSLLQFSSQKINVSFC